MERVIKCRRRFYFFVVCRERENNANCESILVLVGMKI